MTKKVYGIEKTEHMTPSKVRDALVTCFGEAHCTDTGVEGDKEVSKQYCTELVKNIFQEVGGDFDQPTKESLQKVLDKLEVFAEKFRDQKMVQKHRKEIQELVDTL
ncbi:hypothetical protein KKG22_03260 [Patescibacteria group bacterium]|nr:hypothetical protein [Patescibacteria group bacterium]MBU1721168.1 hypothetical protein [Patescibacteria group bacterium]MBU1900902.1 hypothetical protein [Patescibacteria group bacterium]